MPMSRKKAGSNHGRVAGKSSQHSPSATKSLADIARTAAPECRHGVMAFFFRGQDMLPPARACVEKAAIKGLPIADRLFPALTTLTALYGGAAEHEMTMGRIFASGGEASATVDERHRFETAGFASEINVFSMEGMQIPLSRATKGGCVAVAQSLPNKSQDGIREVLIRLNEKALKEEFVILLFLTCPDGSPVSWLVDCCSEVFVVDTYQPEPDASFGFSISAMKLKASHSLGVGKVACDVTIDDKGIRHRWSAFVAATLEERAMHYLRQEGCSLREIGRIFSIDDHVKVWRKLKDIPHVTAEPPENWREGYFECLGLDPGGHDADEQRADDHALLDEDAGDWDDDPAHDPQMKPRKLRIG